MGLCCTSKSIIRYKTYPIIEKFKDSYELNKTFEKNICKL